MSSPKQQSVIGRVIAGRYRVLELLGEGGMGAVYLAEHLSLNKQIALKIVHKEHAGNAELAARFAREAMATSRIEHPNVISALDYGRLPDGTAYLAVQLVRGPSLTRVLRAEGKLAWSRAAAVGAQIADALSAVHGHGIVHRDLKPDNVHIVYLDDGGELVKVLDFGVAKFNPSSEVPGKARADVTQVGFVVGTPGYMAPEQAVGTNADGRADLYALGVILWESIVGRPLWAAPDMARFVERQLNETPPRLSTVVSDPTLPQALDDLVFSLLSRRPSGRPADAANVRDLLREIVKGDTNESPRFHTGARPVPVRDGAALLRDSGPIGTPEAAEDASGAARAAPSPSARPSRRLSRNSRAAWVAAGLMFAVVSALLALVLTGWVELKPRREVSEAARRVAHGLSLPSGGPRPDIRSLSAGAAGAEPASLDELVSTLVGADAREQRMEAASGVLAHTPLDEVPVYVRQMAYLQLGKTCAEKRSAVDALHGLGDARALPMLVQLAQKSRTGCGRKHRDDCLACLRTELDDTIRDLAASRSEAQEASP